MLPSERVDERREALRDVVVAEEPAHDVGVLALDEGVVGGAPRTRLGEVPDVQLVEQRGHGVVDVLGVVVGVETEDDEREQAEQGREQRREEALGDRLDGADELVLGDLVDDVDQVHALGAVAVALVNGVDAQEAGQTVRLRRPALAHRHSRRLRPLDHRAPRPVGPGTPQVVDVAGRDPGEPLEAYVAEDLVLAAEYHPRREPGHLAEVRVHPGQ